MTGAWERRGTVTVTQGNNVVIGVGTYWKDPLNAPQVGNTFYGPDGQAHEVAVIRSATELWLADEYTGTTAANASYQIDTTRVDTIPGLASRVAAVLGYAQGQYDNLDKWAQGGVDEDVTLTSPNGESVTVPSLPKMGKDYAAVGNALPAAERAEASAVRAESAAVATEEDRVDVALKAGQATSSATDALGYKDTAVAAADTATQKAASAATHDASAQAAATRAENAASAVVGAVLDGGECDLSTGVYPQPITVAGKKYSTIWYVAIAGSVSGVSFDVGDILRYTTAKEGYYFKVDAKDEVYSVNGDKGAVVITPEKIGAEETGVAQQLIEQHTSKPGAHEIEGVAGLRQELDDIKAAGGDAVLDVKWLTARTPMRTGYVAGDGQTLPRSLYHDAFTAIQAGLVPVCSDADWLADPTKRGCFTLGDGATTFRIPDYNGKYAGSIGALFQRGDGLNAAAACGLLQGDAIRNITGTLNVGGSTGIATTANQVGAFRTGKAAYNHGLSPAAGGTNSDVDFDASRVVPTAVENRPVAVTGCWAVKLFGAVQNAGSIDATGLATQLAEAQSRISELERWPQSGSNVNGSWIKHRDGTMVCTFLGNFNISINNAYGSLFHDSITLTYPVEFIEPPVVTIGSARWTSGASWGTVGAPPTTTSVFLRIIDIAKRAAGQTEVSYTAIGRWK